MIAHPPCTRLANSGLRVPPKGKTLVGIWQEFFESAYFYKDLRDAPIPLKCIENSIMLKKK